MQVDLTIQDTKGTAHIGLYTAPTAHMEFSIAGPHLIIISHTEVGEEYRGQGVGRQLFNKIVDHARRIVDATIQKYNHYRPHGSLVLRCPEEYHSSFRDVVLNDNSEPDSTISHQPQDGKVLKTLNQ